jgi:hypothetical protein
MKRPRFRLLLLLLLVALPAELLVWCIYDHQIQHYARLEQIEHRLTAAENQGPVDAYGSSILNVAERNEFRAKIASMRQQLDQENGR